MLKDKFFWLLFIFAFVYILGNIGSGSLTTWDEAVYANISGEILKNGIWVTLTQQGVPWFDKPPLYMWSTAVFYNILGVNELSVRLTSALLGLGTVLLLYLFMKELVNKQAALLAGLFLLAFPQYLHFAKMGMLDVSLTFFILLMVYFFWKGQDSPKFLFFAGVALAGAYFTKGFAGFLGLFIIIAYAVFSGNWRSLLKRDFILGIAVSVGLIFLWHYAQYLVSGKDAVSKYFGYHVFTRATSSIEGHEGGINFYQKAIFNKSKPWAAVAYLAFIYMLWLSIRKKDKRAILACSWIVATYLVFSMIKTKLHWYIIPIYPALAISSGMMLQRFFKGKAFNICLGAILIVMVLQVNYSWAFKLDFAPGLKRAANQAKALKSKGADIFAFPSDASDIFYCSFARFLDPDSYAVIASKQIKDAYLLAPQGSIKDIGLRYRFDWRLVYPSDKLALFKITFNGYGK